MKLPQPTMSHFFDDMKILTSSEWVPATESDFNIGYALCATDLMTTKMAENIVAYRFTSSMDSGKVTILNIYIFIFATDGGPGVLTRQYRIRPEESA